MMCATAIRFILLVVSVAMCTGSQHQPQYNKYDENSELPIDILDPSMENQELIDENHPRDLNKLLEKRDLNKQLEKYSDNNSKKVEINENEQDNVSDNKTEMVNKENNILRKKSKHPKQVLHMETIAGQDLILDENDNQELLSILNLDALEKTLELKDTDNDQENMPNLQVLLNSSVFVRGALRNIFEKLFTNPQTLMDTPVADLEKPDIRTSLKFTKNSNTLEVMAELQASKAVQNALAELQASNIVRQAIAELQSSNAVKNTLIELQNSQVIRKVITVFQDLYAVKKSLAEELSKIQMIMTEALKSDQKAMAGDPKALQKAMAELQVSNAVQDAREGLQAFSVQVSNAVQDAMEGLLAFSDAQETMDKMQSGAQETMDKMQTSNDFQEAMEELMALNAMEEAVVEAQVAAEFQKTMGEEKATSHLQEFLSDEKAAVSLHDDIEEMHSLEGIAVTMDKTETEAAIEKATVEFQNSSIVQEKREDAHIANGQETSSKILATDSVETANVDVKATSTHDLTSEKPDAEEPYESKSPIQIQHL